MFKAAWTDFWSKLGEKERKVVRGVAGAVILIGAAVIVGQLTKAKPDPLTSQYSAATKQAAQEISQATKAAK